MRADARADWSRVWLHGRSLEAVESTHVADPEPAFVAYWHGKPVTETLDRAIRRAQDLSAKHGHETVSTGMLAAALVQNPSAAATVALGIASRDQHLKMMQLIQEDLVGATFDVELIAHRQPVQERKPPAAPGSRVGTILIAALIITVFGIGTYRSMPEFDLRQAVTAAIVNPVVGTFGLWVTVKARREHTYAWHIIVIGGIATITIAFAGIVNHHYQ